MPSTEVLCVGEVLWDALPEGLFLGGAPFNVACHLRAAGITASLVSRIGDDRLGDEAMRRAARRMISSPSRSSPMRLTIAAVMPAARR